MDNYIKVITSSYGVTLFEVEDTVWFADDNTSEEFLTDYNEYGDYIELRKEAINKNWITVPKAWEDIIINAKKWELVELNIRKWEEKHDY